MELNKISSKNISWPRAEDGDAIARGECSSGGESNVHPTPTLTAELLLAAAGKYSVRWNTSKMISAIEYLLAEACHLGLGND